MNPKLVLSFVGKAKDFKVYLKLNDRFPHVRTMDSVGGKHVVYERRYTNELLKEIS